MCVDASPLAVEVALGHRAHHSPTRPAHHSRANAPPADSRGHAEKHIPVTRFPRTSVHALAAFCALGAACADVPAPSEQPGPGVAPAASLQSADSEADVACSAATPGERLASLRRGVEALPAAASLSARTRLRPQLGVITQAVGEGQRGRAAEGLRQFVAEIAELRLRAPFEERLALAREAECLLETIEPPTAD